MYRRVLPAVATVAIVLILAGPAAAQFAVFPTADPSRWARAEAGRPDMNDAPEARGLSSVWFFTAHLPIPGGVVLVGEVPMAYTDGPGKASSAALGNPYIGARLQFDTGPLTEFEVGIRLPLAGEQNAAMSLGLWTDLADRAEAFQHRAVPLSLRAVRTMELGHATGMDLAAGTIWWLMSGPEHTEQNIFVTYAGQARTAVGRVHMSAGASGRYSVLGSPIEPLAGATHQVSGSIDYGHPSIRPGIFITVPTTTPGTTRMAATLGLRLLVPLGD